MNTSKTTKELSWSLMHIKYLNITLYMKCQNKISYEVSYEIIQQCYSVCDFIYEISYEMHYNRKFHMNVAPPRPTKRYFSGSLFPTTRRFICTGLPIINLRRSDDRLRFIMGIPIPVSSQWIEALYHILPCPISRHNGVSLHSPF